MDGTTIQSYGSSLHSPPAPSEPPHCLKASAQASICPLTPTRPSRFNRYFHLNPARHRFLAQPAQGRTSPRAPPDSCPRKREKPGPRTFPELGIFGPGFPLGEHPLTGTALPRHTRPPPSGSSPTWAMASFSSIPPFPSMRKYRENSFTQDTRRASPDLPWGGATPKGAAQPLVHVCRCL